MEKTTFSIAEIADRTGLSYDTIRYYEKIGLLPPAKRKENGRLEYDDRTLDRLTFISRLKRTHMPLKEIRRYMASAAAQDYESCYGILDGHKQSIESQMADMKATVDMLNYKLDNFQQLMGQTTLGGD